ncbi:hypothetical protein D3C81_2241940 [compost metagenome]
MAETSATGEPATPPNRVQATTLDMPRPPRMWPTMFLAVATILSATPPWSISSPEKTKKGMARKEKTFMPDIICWKMTATGRPS